MNKQLSLRPFGVKDKVGYMFGNVANDLAFIMASMFLTVFYTDVLKIDAMLVGTMFLLSRVVDAFTDTAMGRIADKVKASKALAAPYVRTRGTCKLFDVSDGGFLGSHGASYRLYVRDVFALGKRLLYGNQYSLRLYGVRYEHRGR